MKRLIPLLVSLCSIIGIHAADNTGLEKFNFFYAGEGMKQKMYKVQDGNVVWSYYDPDGRGEISDAILMDDGHILIAHQYGIKEIDENKNTVWSMDTPEGYEIHSIQPIGENHVVYAQCGDPMSIVVMEIPCKKIVKQFNVPFRDGNSHGQNRQISLTRKGTLLVASMQLKKVFEFDCWGKILNEWKFDSVWGVEALPNGNILVTGNNGQVREINPKGDLVWSFDWTPSEKYPKISTQKSYRLKNGNTLISNWFNQWREKDPTGSDNPPVQYIEVTPQGDIIWELASWNDPANLGPSTTIRLLDEPINRKRSYFGQYTDRHPPLFCEPNQPVGEGKGIYPGRVAWIHSPGVASWDGETGLWVEDRWNNQNAADAMVTEAITTLAGDNNASKAWYKIFKNFNTTHNRGDKGYKKGESIAIKLNMNNALTHRDTIELNSSPFVTLALVRTLVNDANVDPKDIVICEPSRAITDSIYNKIHREFPDVRFIDHIGGDGREVCEYYPDQILYSQDNGKLAKGLAKCIVDATYLINSALLKTHSGPGVTLTGKNWYGATDIALQWRKNSHAGFSQDKRHGKPSYRTFVDFMGHKDLGGKTLLYLIDGTYGSRDVNGAPYPKWQKQPFNDAWCCSLIVSQDGVACDAVAMDLLISEWPDFGSFNYCDEYLYEAAGIPNTNSGTTYDPERNGTPLNKPLGLFEHGDDNRHYEKIDLQYRHLNSK